MAVTLVKEDYRGRRSTYRDGRLQHVRIFLVKTSDKADGTAAAISANDGTTAVPAPGEAYPGRLDVVVVGLSVQPVDDSNCHFKVTVEYESINQTWQREVHPLSRRAEYKFSHTEKTEPYFFDANDDPVITSAGEPFRQTPTREAGETVITITRNEAAFSPAAAEAFANTTNAGSVTIDGVLYAAGTLKMNPIDAEKVYEVYNGVEVAYYRITYVMKASQDGWNQKVADVGFQELDANGKLRPIRDAENNRVTMPYPLDGSGHKKTNPTDSPAELEFVPYPSANWAGLGLS